MKAYSYNPTTKEYSGEVNCQPNPLDGGYLIPGHSVLDKPPIVGHQQIAIWKGAWEIRADHRDEVYWDKSTKEEIKIKEIGEISEKDLTLLQPISDRAIWEIDKWIEPPLTFEELTAIQEAQDKADYIEAMPDIVKELQAKVQALEEKTKGLEAIK